MIFVNKFLLIVFLEYHLSQQISNVANIYIFNDPWFILNKSNQMICSSVREQHSHGKYFTFWQIGAEFIWIRTISFTFFIWYAYSPLTVWFRGEVNVKYLHFLMRSGWRGSVENNKYHLFVKQKINYHTRCYLTKPHTNAHNCFPNVTNSV